MKQHETLHLIKGEDLNHHNTLFAARAAEWLVESGFAAAACEYGNPSGIVCLCLHRMTFTTPIQKGSVVKFLSRVVYAGSTSMMVCVKVADAISGKRSVEGFLTFVTVDENGKKQKHSVRLDEAADEEERAEREAALEIKAAGSTKTGRLECGEKNAAVAETDTKLPQVNHDDEGILKDIECFALDMDGTIYLGEQWIEGAKEFLARIEAAGKRYVFLTNNSSKNADVYVEKLGRMGLKVDRSKIVTSGHAAIYYLKKHFPGKRVFLLGNPMLSEEFRQEGIVLDDKEPEVVVTAFDTTLDYEKMCKVCDFVRAGLPYIATHPDYNCPTETGFIPDAGAIHAFIHASAGRYPDRIIGKPNGDIVDYLIDRIGTDRGAVAMAGDRLYTDIAAGKNNGLKSVLVLSGEATLRDAEVSEVKPDLIFDSVKEMTAFI